jgi:hypothetical protein
MKGERVIEDGFEGEPRRIDDVITDSPQTAATIAHAAGVDEGRVKSHCRFWIKEDLFYDEPIVGSFCYRRAGEQPFGRRG